MRPLRTPRRRRAMALAGTMGALLMILSILLLGALAHSSSQSGLTSTGDSALTSARKRSEVQTAQNLADSGQRLVIQWLRDGGMVSSPTTAAAPSTLGASFFGASTVGGYDVLTVAQGSGGGNGVIRVRIYPYASNEVQNCRLFVIESVGSYAGTSQTIRAALLEGSFARYAYFSDRTPTNWWVAGNTRFNGPVHINGMNAAGTAVDPGAQMNVLWKWGAANQLFRYNGPDSFTTSLAPSQIRWHYETNGNLFTPYGSYWNSVIATGTPPKFEVPPVRMPTATTKQYTAALAGTPEPTAIGVRVPASGGSARGGIFIKGDVEKLKLSASGPSDTVQTMDIYQRDGATQIRTTVTIDQMANTTTVRVQTNSGSGWVPGTTTNLVGVPNGAVYSTGNIESLSGVIANNVMSGTTVSKTNDFTIATPADKDVTVTGGLVYANQVSDASNPDNPLSNAAQATDASGTVGIVSRRVQIARTDDGGNELTDVSLHATVMAFDTIDAADPLTRTPGNFKLLGGYIARSSGTFGRTSGTGALLSGLRVTRNYDARNAINPPPHFPNEENAYRVISYERVSGTLE